MSADVHRSDGIREAPALRSAEPSDRERLWRLDRICFEPGIAYSRAVLRRFLDLPGAVCLVAEDADGLTGFALGYPDERGVAHVVTLDVDPRARRQGIGRRLLEALLERLAAQGASRAVLEVDVRNRGALEFYRTLRFRERRALPSYYGPGLDAIEMERGSTL